MTKDTSGRSSQKNFCSFFKRSPEKVLKILFHAVSKKRSSKNFSGDLQNFNNAKKQCCPRAEDRAIFEGLRLQGNAKDLIFETQDFKMCPQDILKAKDVFEHSTSGSSVCKSFRCTFLENDQLK